MFDGAAARASDVHLPAETHAEKEGTVTHPDGRLQRVRPSVPHPGAVRPVLAGAERAARPARRRDRRRDVGEVFSLLAGEVPFYSDVTLDRIGGMGVRWQDRRRVAGTGRPSARLPQSATCRPSRHCGAG